MNTPKFVMDPSLDPSQKVARSLSIKSQDCYTANFMMRARAHHSGTSISGWKHVQRDDIVL